MQSLRRALTRMGAPAPLAQTLIPDNMDNSLSYSVLNYLKRLKNQAKIEFDRLCNDVLSKQLAAANITKNLANGSTTVTDGVRVIPRTPLKKDLVNIFFVLTVSSIIYRVNINLVCIASIGIASVVTRQIYRTEGSTK